MEERRRKKTKKIKWYIVSCVTKKLINSALYTGFNFFDLKHRVTERFFQNRLSK
jgi:hypothetical protein